MFSSSPQSTPNLMIAGALFICAFAPSRLTKFSSLIAAVLVLIAYVNVDWGQTEIDRLIALCVAMVFPIFFGWNAFARRE